MIAQRIENLDICSECGGACCENMPGAAFPEDFGITPRMPRIQIQQIIQDRLSSGKWQIDLYDLKPIDRDFFGPHDAPAMFLRPAIRLPLGRVSYQCPPKSGCIFQSIRGCELSLQERPLGCSSLIPSPEGQMCKMPVDDMHRESAKAWFEYEEEILDAKMYALDTIRKRLSETS